MCGVSAIAGTPTRERMEAMLRALGHRGPDATGIAMLGTAALAHDRLAILDLSDAGTQPMASADGRFQVVLNGEIYNYVELRAELGGHFRTGTDTEVLLAAFERWGPACLQKLLGMFAFVIWDSQTQTLFAARDRFGVKPLYRAVLSDGSLALASEIKALHAAGLPVEPDPVAWATYLTYGTADADERTFWSGVHAVPPGHTLTWRDGRTSLAPWYDLAEAVGPGLDTRTEADVVEAYTACLEDAVRLRFRADVPVGINVSGGLDSSLLLGLVHATQGSASDVRAFTFITGDAAYDESPWVEQMLATTEHPWTRCPIAPSDVPALAADVAAHQDEPSGGLPTLAYARLFERAREAGVIVLLDGQGMDEQWAGYDYYRRVSAPGGAPLVQGASGASVRPDCLTPEFAAAAVPPAFPQPFGDPLRDTQYRDLRWTKIPRALRFNDRISMRSGTELREPFLDHRLVEMALRQPADRKLGANASKRLVRTIASGLLPEAVVDAPKRPVQTPQREWLRGPLRAWAGDMIEVAVDATDGWLDRTAVRRAWDDFCEGSSDTSFYVWQWIDAGLLLGASAGARMEVPA